MNRRQFTGILGASALAGALGGASADGGETVRRPNVVLIMTDDQGWGDIHSHGCDVLDTPVLDSLADQGARFERFYVCPVCAPTRASLLTGRYNLRCGTSWVTHRREVMRADEITFGEAFRRAGYRTGCFGKWHNGAHYPMDPLGQGFEEFLGFCAGHWNNYFDTTLQRGHEMVPTQGYITDVLTDGAIEFIRRNADQPFVCYVPYNAPHTPFQVPDRYFDKYTQRGLEPDLATIYGMVENIDDNVGRILAALDRLDLAEDTIVIFTTDNGPNTERYNGGMRGRKGSVHEGGVRVPCFLRWTGRVPAGHVVEPLTAHIDLLPTLGELCQIPVIDNGRLDGVSLVPLLAGADSEWLDRRLFTHQSRRGEVEADLGSVRTERYRWSIEGDRKELHDMVADPAEETNIIDDEPEVAAELEAAYRAWFEDVTAAGTEPPPIPVGCPEAPEVEMAAPDAE
ncbi:MAG: sulfatase-like hydrolase/transferase, partial [Armatimonadia bacterium]|nr:sulfatase-like hydrolase/transferase [Armatimonadia bacterium]